MKKLLFLLLSLALFSGCSAQMPADEELEAQGWVKDPLNNGYVLEEEKADTFTSASTNDFYGDFALTGDELWTALSEHTVAGITSTVNPDGSPHAAYIMPAQATKVGEDQYFVYTAFGNQTGENFKATGQGVLTLIGGYDTTLEAHGPACGIGARIRFTVVTDADEIAAVRAANENIKDSNTIVKVVEVKPLG